VVVGVFNKEGRIYVPTTDSLCGKVISLFLDLPESTHFGALKITELVSRDFDRPALDPRAHRYVSSCKACLLIKVPRHARHGINIPLEKPSH
jgi:hypothetical protein